MSGSAVIAALNHVWRTLAPFHLPMGLMGGLLVAVWRHPRNTRDVDILIDVEPTRRDQMLDALTRAGMRAKRWRKVSRPKGLRFEALINDL